MTVPDRPERETLEAWAEPLTDNERVLIEHAIADETADCRKWLRHLLTCYDAALAAAPDARDESHDYAASILRNAAEEFFRTGNPETGRMLDSSARVLLGVPADPDARLVEALEALRWIAAGRTGSYGSPQAFAAAVYAERTAAREETTDE